MQYPRLAFVLGLAFLVAFTLSLNVFWGPVGPVASRSAGQVLVPAGTVLNIPPFGGVNFTVPSEGGVLVGAAEVDHTIPLGAFPVGSRFNCPGRNTGVYYFGSPGSYTANENLTAGAYTWGSYCGSWGNITVTQSIAVLYSGQS